MRDPKRNIAAIVTGLILEKLKSGTLPWIRPWNATSIRPLRHNGEAYGGINCLYLWAVADARGFSSPYWMTLRQANQLGAQVRKGETGSLSVYYATLSDSRARMKGETARSSDESASGRVRFMRAYSVFNADQIDGLGCHYHPNSVSGPIEPEEQRLAVTGFFEPIPVAVHHGGTQAYYDAARDVIQLPPAPAFHSPDHYWSTRAHETIHASGAKHRLAREFGKRFGDKAYAAEELVACLGEAFVCARLGLSARLQDNHASYIAHWVALLESDDKAIFTAAAKAERAVSWLASFNNACEVDAAKLAA